MWTAEKKTNKAADVTLQESIAAIQFGFTGLSITPCAVPITPAAIGIFPQGVNINPIGAYITPIGVNIQPQVPSLALHPVSPCYLTMLELINLRRAHIILLSPYIDLKTIMMISIFVCPKCYRFEPVSLRLSHERTDSLPACVTMLGFEACPPSQHVSQLDSISKHGSHVSEHSSNAAPEHLLACCLAGGRSRHR